MGDRAITNAREPEAAPPSGLFEGSGFLDRMKNGAGSLIHKGAEVGSKIIHSDAAHSVAEGTKNVIHKGVQTGTEIAHNPTTQKIAGQVAQAGKEMAQEKVREVKGVGEAGRRGDVAGVIKHGLPIAADVLMPGVGHALPLVGGALGEGVIGKMVTKQVREKAAEKANEMMSQRSGEHPAAQKQNRAPHQLPDLTIDGHDDHSKVASATKR